MRPHWTPYRAGNIRVGTIALVAVIGVAAVIINFVTATLFGLWLLVAQIVVLIVGGIASRRSTARWIRELEAGTFRAADYPPRRFEAFLRLGSGINQQRWWIVPSRIDFGPMTVPVKPEAQLIPYATFRTQWRARKQLAELRANPVPITTSDGVPTPVKMIWAIVDSRKAPTT